MELNPYLNFNGQCEAAFKFYAEVLGGEVLAMMRLGDSPMAADSPAGSKDMIIHARLQFGSRLLMGSDAWPNCYEAPKGFSVTLGVEDTAEAERIFAALSDGGKIQMPLQETFWAQRFGVLVDRYGTPWMINCEKTA